MFGKFFGGLFKSRNQKVVEGWEVDHQNLVALAGVIIDAYGQDDTKKVRATLRELSKETAAHLMSEDLEFFKMMQDKRRVTPETEASIREFKESFAGIKVALTNFLKKYSADDSTIDEEFFNQFNDIVAVLAERIEFEEGNLYLMMHGKK